MNLEQLLTTYWSQTVLVLAGIGFLIKNGLDTRSKKIEINHTLFQQNKIDAINRYFAIYTEVELMWSQLAIYDLVRKEMSTHDLDKDIIPKLNELRKSELELKLYIENKELMIFNELTKNLNSVKRVTIDVYFSYGVNNSEVDKINKYNECLDNVVKENNILINKLAVDIRKSFNN